MAQKTVDIPNIGSVVLTKKRGNSNIRLSFARSGTVRVSLPYWVPYQAGIEFAKHRIEWINKHRPAVALGLQNGDRIGKAHRLKIEVRDQRLEIRRASVRIKENQIIVTCPAGTSLTSKEVQAAARRGALKALKLEADQLLPNRLSELAKKHNFSYKSVVSKRLTSRWGSCSQAKEITLNIYLMQLPWHLIDYVLVHELVHTEHLNHSADFWKRFGQVIPSPKKLRKELKTHRTEVTSLS